MSTMLVAGIPGDAAIKDGEADGVAAAGADGDNVAAGGADAGEDWLAPHAVDTIAARSKPVARVILAKPPAE